MSGSSLIAQASTIAIDGRALMIEGPPGSGKSSLALALIDRGAMLIGDDGVSLSRDGDQVFASPPPNIAGKLEIRGVGIVELPVTQAPLALILSLDQEALRYPDELARRDILGVAVPVLPFRCGDAIQALRAEWALRSHGLNL
ncbi:serine kinase [Altererythrobacter sp. BO-6]|uniref:HPr kinase/phosphorylase n=1 Tax=Altererythrobacter sp. BO-6 TaxID=2604537 RepID=UPI0013E1121D|nr:HPr kinase/phosphatase C-terminal domain-containing protein [Altererythrobacter sp. BO-6]QIG53423.1 serine kinase [Altererythrobacter sp. BO-6]